MNQVPPQRTAETVARERLEDVFAPQQYGGFTFEGCHRLLSEAYKEQELIQGKLEAAQEEKAIQIEKCRAAGIGEPSGGHGWIDEILGLLRVARQQRDDVERSAQSERETNRRKVLRLVLQSRALRRNPTVSRKWIEENCPP
jgi:hypothetical protein